MNFRFTLLTNFVEVNNKIKPWANTSAVSVVWSQLMQKEEFIMNNPSSGQFEPSYAFLWTGRAVEEREWVSQASPLGYYKEGRQLPAA